MAGDGTEGLQAAAEGALPPARADKTSDRLIETQRQNYWNQFRQGLDFVAA